MFSVVHFKDTNEMEVVHRNWLITDNSCAWPPFISPTKIKKLLLAGTIPSNTWQPNEILVIGHFDTFEKAEKLRDDLSDIVMNIKTEVVEPPPKPAKRHKPTPVIVPLVANVNDDCESQTDNTVGQSDALQPGLPSPYTTTTNAESGNLNNGIIINVSDEPTDMIRRHSRVLAAISPLKRKESGKTMDALISNNAKRPNRSVLEQEKSDSDDEISNLKAKTEELKSDINHWKSKYTSLKKKYNQAIDLNMKLQSKLLNDSSDTDSTFRYTDEPNSNNPSATESSFSSINSTVSSHLYQTRRAVEASKVSTSLVLYHSSKAKENAAAQKEMERDREREAIEMEMSHSRHKYGVYGDSVYAKNLALAIFGTETLLKSSVTGQRCMVRKHSMAKPALCRQKMKLLTDLFIERIKNEEPNINPQDLERRCKRIRTYVAEKIVTMLKTVKLKGSTLNTDDGDLRLNETM